MKVFISLLFLISAAGSCQHSDPLQTITANELEVQLTQIKDLVAEAGCTENSQCSYMAYGSKACGGPQGYLVFSSEVDKEKLKNLVATYTAAEAAYNEQNGIVSDCSVVTPPQTIGCVDGNCVKMD